MPDKSNFTIIPNRIDDLHLTPIAFRLYGHIKRVAGDDGKCFQSGKTLAEVCSMSVGSVSRGKAELVKAGLIRIEAKTNAKNIYHEITIVNVWNENSGNSRSQYEGISPHEEPSQHEGPSPQEEPSQYDGMPSQCEPINNPFNKIPIHVADAARRSSQSIDLSAGQKMFLSCFGAKRFKNPVQLAAVLKLEQEYGLDKLTECTEWAAKQNMTLEKAIVSVETAIRNWGLKKPGNGKPTNDNKSPSIDFSKKDPDLEFLRMNKKDDAVPLRAGCIERLKRKGTPIPLEYLRREELYGNNQQDCRQP